MLIKQITYKVDSKDSDWKSIPIQLDSVIYSETNTAVRQGNLLEAVCTAYVPHVTIERDADFNQIAAKGGLFILKTVADEFYHLGVQKLKASFTYTKVDGDKPGSKSGYNIRISYKTSPTEIFKSLLSLG